MSSSDEPEFGSYNPTTPARPLKNMARTKSNSHAIAGPSSQPAASAPRTTKRRGKVINVEVDELDDEQNQVQIVSANELEGSAEDEIVAVPQAKGKAKANESRQVNGGPVSNAKRKVPPRSKGRQAPSRHDVVVLDDSDQEPQPPPQAKLPPTGNVDSASSRTNAKELSRLRHALADSEAQREDLAKQLDELFLIRHTEAEQALEVERQRYRAVSEAQENLIRDLTSQLAKIEPLTRTGKNPLLQFLTRDAADEEKNIIKEEVSRLKEAVSEKDNIILQKDGDISRLRESENELRRELKLEVERSKTLVSKKTQAPLSTADGTNAEVVKLYENVTNLLVYKVNYEPSPYLQHKEHTFTCVYTHVLDDGEGTRGDSLNFNLRFFHEIRDPKNTASIDSPDQLKERVQFSPLHLDKESHEFVEKLGFLNSPFTFDRGQLPLFLGTISKQMGDAVNENEDEDADEDMEDED